MNAEPSPRPWHTANFINGIEDANNGKVAANIRDADAALIVDAVNAIDATKKLSIKLYNPIRRAEAERDRLCDIVRRFLDLFTPGTIHPAGTMERLLREARAAIGEDAK